MISSMTGYGRGESGNEQKSFVVEIKSVNHRYNDIIVKASKKLSCFEEKIRSLIKSRLKRGRIEVYISFEQSKDEDVVINPNVGVVKQYYNALRIIKDELNLKDEVNLSLLTSFPEVFEIKNKEEDSESIWMILEPAVKEALDMLIDMRKKEGIKLAEDIKCRSEKIYEVVKKIEEKSSFIVKEYKEKLYNRIKELLNEVEVDESRLALELAIYADKSNINEEIVRLYSHIQQLNSILNEDGAVGRKLDFLIQEMNREINTIGSKSSNIEISNYVIDVKSELEKIREQVQNIE
ncbi:YicC/YloC family endoribonuclease [Caminicella sporogenes]|nr:YicC/YloC family endoribonuclease [Caminicella sporogenes]RKD28060.1 YicC family protein [Caminicella sporogenes]WIF94576.1 YicC/YloC family endoribonuclease [Caminicella sporogenes]